MQPRTRLLSETTLRLPKEEGKKEKPRLEPSRSSIHLRKSGWMHGWLVCFRPIGVLWLRPITLGCMVEAVVSNGDTEGAYELIQSMEQDDSCRSIRFSPWCQRARIIDSKIGWSWRKHFRPWDKSPFSAYSETKKVSEYTGRKIRLFNFHESTFSDVSKFWEFLRLPSLPCFALNLCGVGYRFVERIWFSDLYSFEWPNSELCY